MSVVGAGILYGSEVAASCTAGGVSVTCEMLTRDTFEAQGCHGRCSGAYAQKCPTSLFGRAGGVRGLCL